MLVVRFDTVLALHLTIRLQASRHGALIPLLCLSLSLSHLHTVSVSVCNCVWVGVEQELSVTVLSETSWMHTSSSFIKCAEQVIAHLRVHPCRRVYPWSTSHYHGSQGANQVAVTSCCERSVPRLHRVCCCSFISAVTGFSRGVS